MGVVLKKLFVKNSYKKRLIKKSKDEIKKRQKNNKTNKKGYSQQNKFSKYKIADKLRSNSPKYTIEMPRIFSISENTDESLNVFNDIYTHISNGHKLFLDMGKIDIVTSDALLYILSIFDYFRLSKVPTNIKGNFPLNNQVKEFLVQSHFFDYVKSDITVPKHDEHILHIESGMKVSGSIVKDVVQFALKHLGQNISPKSRAIYRIIIEMMGNTVEHAYRNENESSKWYLMARHDKNDGKVKFAFLDGGFGVPTTIRKNFPERVFELFSKMTGTSSDDSRLLLSALNGNFRTKTGKKYRGKGLPNIYMSYNDKFIDNLRIISNYGYIDKGNALRIKHKFHGTLYAWEFI